jgi:multidrug efflux pump subunit AcrB
VSGPDYAQVRLIANRVAAKTGASPFTREVNLTAGEPERVITFNVNQTAARAAGVSSEDIAQTLNTVWSGRTVTTVRDNDRLVDVVLRANDKERLDISTLSSLVLTTSAGKKIPLAKSPRPYGALTIRLSGVANGCLSLPCKQTWRRALMHRPCRLLCVRISIHYARNCPRDITSKKGHGRGIGEGK